LSDFAQIQYVGSLQLPKGGASTLKSKMADIFNLKVAIARPTWTTDKYTGCLQCMSPNYD